MRLWLLGLVAVLPLSVQAVQTCELNGQHVNPANGSTTAGKTGLMRCRDADGGPVLREQELKNGVFMGVVRYFKDGVLQREYHVNEQGNQDGLSREFAATTGSNTLLREETYRNSKTIGIARAWHANGQLRHVAFHGDDGRAEASADFTPQGQLKELRCASRPLLAPHADDAAWCGHGSTASASVPLYADNGTLRGRVTHERGERRKTELLWDNGKPREQQENSAGGGVERSFSAEGIKRREVQWSASPGSDGRPRRTTTLEQEFHDSGTLVHERRWKPSERGGELLLEQHWYLNGQPRDRNEYVEADGRTTRRETRFHDSGRIAFEGSWTAGGRGANQAIGMHKRYDAEGRLRNERHHDDKGRVTREREFDESGRVSRDDELFEDGSRKAYSR